MLSWLLLTPALAAEPPADRLAALFDARALRLAEGLPEVPPEAYARALEGHVATGLEAVEGHASKRAWGVAVVPLPIGPVWAAVQDEVGAQDYTAITYTERVAGEPCAPRRDVLQVLPLPLASARWWITEFRVNEALVAATSGRVRELAWTSSVDADRIVSEAGRARIGEATPVGFTRGGWLVADLGDARTLVEYAIWSEPGGRLPAGLLNWFATGSVEDTLHAIARFATEGRPGCPVEP